MNNQAKRIFIADDDRDILLIMKMMLQTKGYKVHATVNANDIFEYKDNLPDLILLDVWMSGIDGREICENLKKDELKKNIPVIFISANSTIEKIAEKYHSDYISKPFDMQHLLNKINDVLEEPVSA
jgi:DNA-binding response OmpR family regulator